MRYSLESRYRKYVEGQGFRNILDKSIDAGKDFAKIAGKKVLHKSAEVTGEMIGNKVADRITRSSRNKAQKEDDRIMEET